LMSLWSSRRFRRLLIWVSDHAPRWLADRIEEWLYPDDCIIVFRGEESP